MEIGKLPVWSAYIIAPLFLLGCGFTVIANSDRPVTIGGFMIGCGLICAAALHGYVWIKGKFSNK